VPELSASGWAESATVRDLLANRARLPLRDQLEFGFSDRTDQDGGALARLVADAAAGGPAGSYWSYTNVGWCVRGRVIETVAGAAWEDAMRQHLSDRAGMAETRFVTGGTSEPRATGHEVTAEGPVPPVRPAARRHRRRRAGGCDHLTAEHHPLANPKERTRCSTRGWAVRG
jgi:CubicO group peptidase (beta-lactamase class C family)